MHGPIATTIFANIDDAVARSSNESIADAARVLSGLDHARVPVVLCSAMTRAEVEGLQLTLGLRHPFVCERGCAAFIPGEYFPFEIPASRDVAGYHALELGRSHIQIAQQLRRIADRQGLEIVTFAEMSVEEVARACRLSLLKARLAKLVEYGERFLMGDAPESARHRLTAGLEAVSLNCAATESYHQVGSAVDPAAAINQIASLYRRAFGAMISVGAAEATALFQRQPRTASTIKPDVGVPPTLREWAQSVVDAAARFRRPRVSVAP